MPIAEPDADRGSPLWLINLDVVRDRWRTIGELWRSAWPDVLIAYAHEANGDAAILAALAEAGAGHYVGSAAQYDAATSSAGGGEAVVLGGAGAKGDLLARAASDGALVVADSGSQLQAARDAGVARAGVRVALGGGGVGPEFLGVDAAEVAGLARGGPGGGGRLEAVAMHLAASRLARGARSAIGSLVPTWPHPPERYANAAKTLGSLATRLGIPAVDVGGGFPPAPDEALYVRAVTGALGSVGFEGRLIVEPGRAVVGEAVDLRCTVVAVKRLQDGTPCVVVDAGHALVPGALWRWPHISPAGGPGGPTRSTMVVGASGNSMDVLHPAAPLPALEEGDALVLRRVGAYNQSRASAPAAVAVYDAGRWAPAAA